MPNNRFFTVAPVFAILLITMAAGQARAGISLSPVTSYSSWDEEDGTSNSAASQYVRLHNRGSVGEFRLDVEGYGRVTQLEEEAWPGDENPNRLYTLAATLSAPEGGGSLTLGRQYVPALAGPEFIDGLSLSTDLGKMSLHTMWGYAADVTGEVKPSDADEVLGAGFDYRIRTGMYFSLDYGRSMDDDSLLSEFLATEWIYSWHRFTKAYANFNWDLMSRTLHESLVGTRLFFSDRLSAIFELSHNVQSFDSDSIYSVFAVTAAYSRSFSFLFTPSPRTRYLWDYTVEDYQEGGGGRRYEVGGRWTPGRARVNASLLQHKGTGGDLVEVVTGITVSPADHWTLGVGGEFSRTETDDQGSAKSSQAWLGGGVEVGSLGTLDLRLERTEDDLDPDNPDTWSGRISFELEL